MEAQPFSSRFLNVPLQLITELNGLHDAEGLLQYVVWHAFVNDFSS